MIQEINASVDVLNKKGEKFNTLILNKKSHLDFYEEIRGTIEHTTPYSKIYYYKNMPVCVDVDVLKNKRLSDDEFLLGNL